METVQIKRKTNETDIDLKLTIHGEGKCSINIEIGFFKHMLESFCKHSSINLDITAKGDIEVDFHHTVEDIGICLGMAFDKALGEKKGIKRFGWASVPMDDSLSSVSIDISGRPYLVYKVNFPTEKIGTFNVELFKEFFKAFSDNAKLNLHIINEYGENSHHIIESVFKAFAKALSMAVEITGNNDIPSTKGTL